MRSRRELKEGNPISWCQLFRACRHFEMSVGRAHHTPMDSHGFPGAESCASVLRWASVISEDFSDDVNWMMSDDESVSFPDLVRMNQLDWFRDAQESPMDQELMLEGRHHLDDLISSEVTPINFSSKSIPTSRKRYSGTSFRPSSRIALRIFDQAN
jgi:hypothetical protein